MYADVAGGVAVSPDGRSGDALGEVGVSIAPNVYVFGDIGQFHNLQPSQLQPSVYNGGGTLPGSTTVPVTGDDVTSQLVSLDDFTAPPVSTAFMFAVGGGVEAPIAPHLIADVGYRVSRGRGGHAAQRAERHVRGGIQILIAWRTRLTTFNAETAEQAETDPLGAAGSASSALIVVAGSTGQP